MKRKAFITMMVFILAIMPLLGTAQQANAEDAGHAAKENAMKVETDDTQTKSNQDVSSAEDLKALVEQFAKEGEFENDQAVHALTLHLTAVSHYEKQDESKKVIKHMKGFKVLLNHQKENGLISEDAYKELKTDADALIQKWNSLTIVKNGQAHAVVVVSGDHPNQKIPEPVKILTDYVQRSTGVVLPVVTEKDLQNNKEKYANDARIYVGQSAPDEKTFVENKLKDLNDQGFVIHPVDNSVTIVGPSDAGTINGVSEFLERYVGVRWLMTGEDGVDVPQLTDLNVTKEDVLQQPAFKYRSISAGVWGSEFLKRNKFQGAYDIKFIHNLYSLFPVEKYGKTHPEFYPNGKPPAAGEQAHWQPCFTAEGTVDAAVSGILDYFDKHPNTTSFSLGVNDSGGYCETDPDNPQYPGKRNSIGLVDMSDIYYKWVNEVVEQVRKEYPDKWFGLLAYQNVMDPPSFKLDSHIVPFLTKDRMTWIDDGIRNENHEQMDAWNEVANQMAWYDYMYGTFYMLPRVYPHQMAENYRYAERHHVIGNYTEMYFNAGDGPKAWLSTKLQWNPDQDVDALLQEWYERAVGKEAAPDLKAYYDLWENFWTKRIKDSPWFQAGKGDTYLEFTSASYLNLVTDEDLAESEQLLDSVVAKAKTDKQKKRAGYIKQMFNYYKASVLSYSTPQKTELPEDETSAMKMLDDLTGSAEKAELAKKRHDLIEEFEDIPALQFHVKPRVDWSGWDPFKFWPLVDYLSENEPEGGAVTDKLHEMTNQNQPSNVRAIAKLLEDIKAGNLTSLTENPSFEKGDKDAPPWIFWDPGNTANIQRVEGTAHTGNSSLLLEQSSSKTGAYETFDIQSGLTAARVHYYTPEGTRTKGFVRLVFSPQDADGKTLGNYISKEVPLSDTAGKWASVGLLEDIPVKIKGEKVTSVLLNAQVHNAPDAQVYMDDVEVYQDNPSNNNRILTKNSSFETGDKSASPWYFWVKNSGTMERVEDKAHTGDASVLLDKMERGGPAQTFNLKSGPKKTQVYYYTPSNTKKGTIQLVLHVQNDEGKKLVDFQTNKIPLSQTAGDWSSLDLSVDIPDTVKDENVSKAQVVAVVDGAEDTQVYLDDFIVCKQNNEEQKR